MPLGGIRIIRLELIEIAELIQSLKTQLPIPRIVDLPLLERDLAADDLVSRGSVPLKFNPSHVELLALVHIDFKVGNLFFAVKLGIGNRSEVDVARLTISLAQILETLGDFFAAENISVLHREEVAQCWRIRNRFVVLKRNRAEMVAIALFDRHRDIGRFASS